MADKALYVGGGELLLGGELGRADLLAEGGTIRRIGTFGPPRGAEILDASGLLVLPGGIDDHVHFREPGQAEKEGYDSGTRAALHGGVTTLLEIQNNAPLLISGEACRAKADLVGPKARTDFGFYGNLVQEALGRLEELAPFCLGLKLFAGGTTGMAGEGDYGGIRLLLRAAAAAGLPVAAHCEDSGILARSAEGSAEGTAEAHGLRFRPPAAETLSVAALLELVRESGVVLHFFHLSTGRAAELVAAARSAGLPVSSSTCPHYLWFEAADAARLGNLLKVNPGLHGAEDRDALRRHLASGAIDTWSSDHAPHFAWEKARPYAQAPAGIPSVDLFWPLLLTLVDRGVLDLARAVDAAAVRPASIHRLPRKGALESGKDADLVLVDPRTSRRVAAERLLSRAGQSPYEGLSLKGWPLATVLRGELVFVRDPGGSLHFPGAPRGRRLVRG